MPRKTRSISDVPGILHQFQTTLLILFFLILAPSESFGVDTVYPLCADKSCRKETTICVNGGSVIMSNGTYEFGETDLTIPRYRGHSIVLMSSIFIK